MPLEGSPVWGCRFRRRQPASGRAPCPEQMEETQEAGWQPRLASSGATGGSAVEVAGKNGDSRRGKKKGRGFGGDAHQQKPRSAKL